MKPEYLTRMVTISKGSFEALLGRAMADAVFPSSPSAKSLTGAEFATLMNSVITYMEDMLFAREEDGGAE